MAKMIKLSDDLGNRFETLRIRLKYTKNTDFISDICTFFDRNPIDLHTQNFKSSFDVLTDFIGKRFNQLQARITIDIENFNTFDKKFQSFNEIYNETVLKKNLSDIENNHLESDSKNTVQIEISGLKETIIKQEESIRNWKKLYSDLEIREKELFRNMKVLNDNIKIENGVIGGKKVFINLTVEETEKLFILIP